MTRAQREKFEQESDDPGQDEIDGRHRQQREESVEGAGPDQVAGARDVDDGDVADDGCFLEERNAFPMEERQAVADGLRKLSAGQFSGPSQPHKRKASRQSLFAGYKPTPCFPGIADRR